MKKDIYLGELIATRISHDLIGNIGAVANAVELINEGDEDDKDDIGSILNFSSKVLTRRLKFFRLCFGLSNVSVKTVEELTAVTAEYLSTLGNPSQPVTADFHISTPQIYKLVMPAAMIMADTLVKGGKISVRQNDASLSVTAASDAPLNRSRLDCILQIIGGGEPEENISAYAPLFYLIAYLKGSGVAIRLDGQTLIVGA